MYNLYYGITHENFHSTLFIIAVPNYVNIFRLTNFSFKHVPLQIMF